MSISLPLEGGLTIWLLGLLLIFFLFLIRLAYASRFVSPTHWPYRMVKIFRGGIFLLLLISLSNLEIDRSKKVEKVPLIKIYFDNSISAVYHQSISKESLNDGYHELFEEIQAFFNNYPKRVDVESFSFGSQVKKLDFDHFTFDFIEPVTDFMEVLKSAIQVKPEQFLAGVVIVSDGLVTKGEDPIDMVQSLDVPIYAIGIGKEIPMVDVNIETIRVPTVGIKGENVVAEVIISSVGSFKERVNVSLSKGGKLISSRMLSLTGKGSLVPVKFQFKLDKPGKSRYTVQVASVREEINIANNRSSFDLMTLKDRFKVALITGAPNPNTSFIKRILNSERHFKLEHYIYFPSGWKPSISGFWRQSYDLIILDNFPTLDTKKRWVKDLNRKTSSSLAFIPGQNVVWEKAVPYFPLLGIKELSGPENFTEKYSINFTEKGQIHPVFAISSIVRNRLYSGLSLPPIQLTIPVEPRLESLKVLAVLTSHTKAPLFILGSVTSPPNDVPYRTAIFTSSDLWQLHLKSQLTEFPQFIEKWWQRTFNWLVKASGEEELYFRVNKNSFQQGEPIQVSGTVLDLEPNFRKNMNVTLKLVKEGEVMGVYPLSYSLEMSQWVGSFFASKPGEYHYTIEVYEDDILKGEQVGSFLVEESQIELNKVYLNKPLLVNLTKYTGGNYFNWEERKNITDHFHIQKEELLISQVIRLGYWLPVMILVVFLLAGEWIFRKLIGLQ